MYHRRIIFPPWNDQNTRDKQILSRRMFLKGIGIVCLGFGPFIHACENMSWGIEKMKPSIDLAAPIKTETATFAMG